VPETNPVALFAIFTTKMPPLNKNKMPPDKYKTPPNSQTKKQ